MVAIFQNTNLFNILGESKKSMLMYLQVFSYIFHHSLNKICSLLKALGL